MTAAAVLVASGLLVIPAAVAKDFGPGDLRVCGRAHCASITSKRMLRILSAYYWGPRQVVRTVPVHRGAPGFALRFRDGYASGFVGGANLDRFRGQGFSCGRFVRGRWYRLPAEASAGLRKLATGLRPLRVPAPPRSC